MTVVLSGPRLPLRDDDESSDDSVVLSGPRLPLRDDDESSDDCLRSLGTADAPPLTFEARLPPRLPRRLIGPPSRFATVADCIARPRLSWNSLSSVSSPATNRRRNSAGDISCCWSMFDVWERVLEMGKEVARGAEINL